MARLQTRITAAPIGSTWANRETRTSRLLVLTLAAAGVLAAVAVHLAGSGAFPSHPLAVLALGGATVATWSATDSAPARTVRALRALSIALLVYLWLGVAACAVDAHLLASAWSAAWIPVNG